MLGFDAIGAKPLAGESPRGIIGAVGIASTLQIGTIAHAARAVYPTALASALQFGTIARVAAAAQPKGIRSRLVSSRPSTATYFDVTGVLQLAAVDVIRPNYDPITHVLSGNMVEADATNLYPTGNTPFPSAWVASPTANSAGTTTDIAPLYAAAAVNKHVRNTTATDTNVGSRGISGLISGQILIISAYIWIPVSATLTSCTWQIEGNVTAIASQQPSLAIRGQWQRVWFRATLTGTSTNFVPRVVGANGEIIYTTCWQAEYAQPGQTTPTSYIPTSGAVASRAADIIAQWGAPAIRQQLHPTGLSQVKRASTATYFDATGVIQLAAVDAVRPNYDPITHAFNGNLIEPVGSTQLLANSNALAAAWNSVNSSDIARLYSGTVLQKSTAPSGGVSYNVNATGFTFLPAQRYLASAYVYVPSAYAGGAPKIDLDITGSTGPVRVQADLSKRDQWQRIWGYQTTVGGVAGSMTMRQNSPFITGDVFYHTCWMLEAVNGATTTPSSYMPSSGTAAARAPDIANPVGALRPRNVAAMTGIASTLQIGTIAGSNRPHPPPLASKLIFGLPKFQLKTPPLTGLASHVAFGAAPKTTQRVRPVGMASHVQISLLGIRFAKSILQYFHTATPGFSHEMKPRQTLVAFSDGYTQAMPQGLTAVDRTLTLSWSEIPQDDVGRLIAVLRANVGKTISFVAPDDTVPRNWLPTKWGRGHPYPTADSFNITFEERTYTKLPS